MPYPRGITAAERLLPAHHGSHARPDAQYGVPLVRRLSRRYITVVFQ